jgi:hypothetical protein
MRRQKAPGERSNQAPIISAPLREAEAFNDGHTDRGPVANNFLLDFHNSPRSRWNKHAASIFAAEYILYHPGIGDDTPAIRKAFMTHILTLREQFIKYSQRISAFGFEDGQEKVDNARATRRRGVGFHPSGNVYPIIFSTPRFVTADQPFAIRSANLELCASTNVYGKDCLLGS